MAFDEEKRRYDQLGGNDEKGGGEEERVDADALYDSFPRGADTGSGPEQGFNRWVKINDPKLFTDEARRDPVIRAFLETELSFNYAQFKSSHRETEYFIHKPHAAMTGQVDGIEGRIEGLSADAQVATLVLNHERTLAWRITRTMTVSDGSQLGQVIYKEGDGSA